MMSLKNTSMGALKKTIYGLWGICFIWMSHGTLRAQTSLSDHAEISILTIGPGEALYDRFGHSAFRVSDPTKILTGRLIMGRTILTRPISTENLFRVK